MTTAVFSCLGSTGRALVASALVVAFATVVLAFGGSTAQAAGAADVDIVRPAGPSAARTADAGALLPVIVSARNADQAAAATVLGGYDASRSSAVFSSTAHVALTERLGLSGGFVYTPSYAAAPMQPHLGLRLQVFRQDRHGVDGGVALFYRLERFSDDEGLIQGLVSLGRRWGGVGTFLNISYGQDPEGDDRDGELRLAVLYRLTNRLQVGAHAHLRVDLFSTDLKRQARNDSSYDGVAGPLVTYAVGNWAFLAQAGVSQIRAREIRTGLVAMGGIARVF